jgi:hypothetical protein
MCGRTYDLLQDVMFLDCGLSTSCVLPISACVIAELGLTTIALSCCFTLDCLYCVYGKENSTMCGTTYDLLLSLSGTQLHNATEAVAQHLFCIY